MKRRRPQRVIRVELLSNSTPMAPPVCGLGRLLLIMILGAALASNARAAAEDGPECCSKFTKFNDSGCSPAPCCRRAGLQYAFRHEESGSQHDFGCC
jgi:hypothetical protein